MIGDSLPIMNHVVSSRFPSPQNQNTAPNSTRLTLEQQYADLSNRILPNQSYSDPYSDYLATLNSCSDITREKIIHDDRYSQIYFQCENAIKQSLYARIIPEIVASQQGRLLFEQLHTTTKSLKEEYAQKDLQRERETADLEKRLAEREKSLEQKERQIDEILKKAGTSVHQPVVQQTYKDKQYSNNKSQGGGNTK
jgi:hypothetical protein